MKTEIEELRRKQETTVTVYERYILSLSKIMKRDHVNFVNQIEYTELQVDCAEAQVAILTNRIDKYLQVAKQAKSVLRIPRLCNQYHNKIVGVSESETGQILEQIYLEWYATVQEERKRKQALKNQQPNDDSANTQNVALSKIEEALIDRSVSKSLNQGSKLSSIKPSVLSIKEQKIERETVYKSIEDDKTRMFSPQTLAMSIQSSRSKDSKINRNNLVGGSLDSRCFNEQDSYNWA